MKERCTFVIIGLLLCGVLLRLYKLDSAFEFDEIASLKQVRKFLDRPHPPLYYFINDSFVGLFGETPYGARLPSFIFGVLGIIFMYFLGKRMFDEKTGIVASILMTFSPFAVYYSQNATMYAMTLLIEIIAIYFFIRGVEENDAKVWFLWSISMFALMYTHYLTFPLLIVKVIWLYTNNRSILKARWFFFAIAILPVVLEIGHIMGQLYVCFSGEFRVYQRFMAGQPLIFYLYSPFVVLGQLILGNVTHPSAFFLQVALGAVSIAIAIPALFKTDKKGLFLAYCILMQLCLLWVVIFMLGVSTKKMHLVSVNRYFITIVPALYISLANRFVKTCWRTRILVALVFMLVFFVMLKYYYGARYYDGKHPAVKYLDMNYQKEDIVVFYPYFVDIFWYYSDVNVTSCRLDWKSGWRELERCVYNNERVWFVRLSWSEVPAEVINFFDTNCRLIKKEQIYPLEVYLYLNVRNNSQSMISSNTK
ncbi:MAG: glycosyltransferase family 39 protein [Candidatus Micrarchaeia archaeon]